MSYKVFAVDVRTGDTVFETIVTGKQAALSALLPYASGPYHLTIMQLPS